MRGRILNFKYFGREFSIHSSKLIAGAMLFIMGVVTVGLGLTGTMIPAPGSALISVLQAQFGRAMISYFSTASEAQFAVVAIAALLVVSVALLGTRLKRSHINATA
jgi:hypothetical protein